MGYPTFKDLLEANQSKGWRYFRIQYQRRYKNNNGKATVGWYYYYSVGLPDGIDMPSNEYMEEEMNKWLKLFQFNSSRQ